MLWHLGHSKFSHGGRGAHREPGPASRAGDGKYRLSHSSVGRQVVPYQARTGRFVVPPLGGTCRLKPKLRTLAHSPLYPTTTRLSRQDSSWRGKSGYSPANIRHNVTVGAARPAAGSPAHRRRTSRPRRRTPACGRGDRSPRPGSAWRRGQVPLHALERLADGLVAAQTSVFSLKGTSVPN